jgi:hypothetical protein
MGLPPSVSGLLSGISGLQGLSAHFHRQGKNWLLFCAILDADQSKQLYGICHPLQSSLLYFFNVSVTQRALVKFLTARVLERIQEEQILFLVRFINYFGDIKIDQQPVLSSYPITSLLSAHEICPCFRMEWENSALHDNASVLVFPYA